MEQTRTFEEATRIEAIGDGSFRARLDPSWHGDPGPHGGHVAALITRALATVGREHHREPIGATFQFLRVPRGPAVEIHVDVVRRGSTVTSVSVHVLDGEEPAVTGLATLSALRPSVGFVDLDMPEVPPPQDCSLWEGEPWSGVPVFNRTEIRWERPEGPLDGTEQTTVAAWIRPERPVVVDAPWVTFVSDAFMPGLYSRVERPIISPTIELQLTFHQPLPELPEERGWLLARFRSVAAWGGFYEELGDFWTPDGRLLGWSRQLAAVRTAPEGSKWAPQDAAPRLER